ncbi:MAG: Ig-like domain-containing protein, partial [Candidatus Limnocylindrales bacterium]
ASSTHGPLAAGSYGFQATYSGNANYNGSTGDCEPFTITRADTLSSTAVRDGQGHDVTTTSVPLGTQVHDEISISGRVDGYPFTGNASFQLYSGLTCATGGTALGSAEIVAVVDHGNGQPGTASSSVLTLGAGSYSYLASYAGDGNYKASAAGCEPFTINRADTTTLTDVRDAQNRVGTLFPLGTTVHDTATLSGQVGAFSLNGTATVTYDFFFNDTCNGTPAASETVTVNADGTVPPSSGHGPLGYGAYGFRATYSGNSDYNGSLGGCEPFQVTNVCPTVGNLDSNGNPILNRDINSYALFAFNSLTWKGGALLNSGDWGHIYGGNVGVNNAAPNSSTFVLNFGTSGRGIMSPGSELVGDSARADDSQDVIYYFFANRLNPSFGASVLNPNPSTTKGNYPFGPLPVLAQPALPFTAYSTMSAFQAAAGVGNYIAPFIVYPGQTFSLDATKWYGGIDVRDGATIKLGNGTYRVWDFTAIGKKVTFTTTDATTLNVDVHLNPNDDFKFGVGTNAGTHLNIGAATSTYANSNARVTTWSNRAEIWAQYFAPTGWLDVGALTTMHGRFWAQTITGDPNDNVMCLGG